MSRAEPSAHVLRDAVPADAGMLGDVLQDWLDATPWMPRLHDRAETVGFLRGLIERQVVRIGTGTGGVGFLARQGVEVDALYLAPGARGAGLGRALLDEAKVGGHLVLGTFQANLGARRFYAREGFREVEWTDGAANEARLPDVRLEWRS